LVFWRPPAASFDTSELFHGLSGGRRFASAGADRCVCPGSNLHQIPLRAAAGALSSAGDKDGPLSERQRVSVHPHADGISGGYPQGKAQGVFFCLLFLYTQEKEGGVGRRPRHVGTAGNIATAGDHPLLMHSHAGAWERD